MKWGGHVYLMTNKNRTTLYCGVTSDLVKRVQQHKEHAFSKSSTARYNLEYLVYYEGFHTIEEAISREKQIKGGSRKKKEALIASMNPEWNDLFDSI
ncbi:MAG: GIY-YIG nuclease family protein, partial [Flavobacteriales bacterium]|nr:GIY-YIG nuclease family protein [Flavobacteriales bacterium]